MKPLSRISVLRRASSLQTLLRKPATGIRTKKSLQSLNQWFPISCLPNELFVLILEFVHDMELYGDYRFRFNQWVRISLVCRAWREVILNSPTLWRHIRVIDYRQAKVMFERSRGAAIDVLYLMFREIPPEPTSEEVRISWLVSDNVYRAKLICLQGPIVVHLLSDVQTSVATPLLEDLSLTAPDSPGMEQMGRGLEALFSGASHLRSLRLSGICIQPSSSLFTAHLSSLSLQSYPSSHPGPYSLKETIDLLKRVPSLTSLHLGYWTKDFDSGGQPTDIVELRKLQSLTFFGNSLLQCILFMQHLSLSPDVAVRLDCNCDDLIEDLGALTSLSAFPHGHTDPNSLQSFTIENSMLSIMICTWPSHARYNFKIPPPGSLSLKICVSTRMHDASDGLIQLLRLFSLHSVTYLSLLSMIRQFDWAPILPLFGGVTAISLFDSQWPQFARDLVALVPAEASEDSSDPLQVRVPQSIPFLCPHLRELRFARRWAPSQWSVPTSSRFLFFEVLAILLELRKANGVTMRVMVQDDWLTIAELRDLKALKRKKVWRFVRQ